jgi:cathepsin A (carboxypeptidase C)
MSSCFGLLFELGPCLIADEGKNVTHNPYSWNTHANIIFLDQPVNVGFSYSNDQTVNNTLDAGKDMYAFLQLFLVRFPKYADAPFHVAGESYGGMYGPRIASIIHKANKDIAFAPGSGLKHISLASVVLGNGWTDPLIQMASLPDYTCEGPYHVYDDPNGVECTTLRSKVPTCQRLIQSCYRTGSSSDCAPAQQYCEAELVDPVFRTCTVLLDACDIVYAKSIHSTWPERS